MSAPIDKFDLIGRAAARLDLNATLEEPSSKIEPWIDVKSPVEPAPEEPISALEPTILASLVKNDITFGMPPAAEPPPPSSPLTRDEPSIIVAAAEATRAEEIAAQERTAEIIAANNITVNWAQLEENGYLTPESQRSLKAEEFRIVKRPLLRTAFKPEGRHKSIAHVAMVTSPGQGDGKTFTALNLAVSMASERDLHVLLIDADIRGRGLSRALGVNDRLGLTDLLTQPETSMPSVYLHTDIANLAIIPAGQQIAGTTEVFASQAMARLARDITTRYADRFIIIDTPPVLASSEAGVLAAHVGQVVMVIQANHTSKRAIAEALALVTACPTVNFILNQTSVTVGLERFGYYGTYKPAEAH